VVVVTAAKTMPAITGTTLTPRFPLKRRQRHSRTVPQVRAPLLSLLHPSYRKKTRTTHPALWRKRSHSAAVVAAVAAAVAVPRPAAEVLVVIALAVVV